jgi:hypothetical protein
MLSRAISLGALGLLAAACGRTLPPAMLPATTLQPQPVEAGSSRVVFMRPNSACDAADYSVVVDAQGHFVGNVAPGTRVAVTVPPGDYAFFGWSNIDLRDDRYPEFNPVTAARVHAEPGATNYVALVVRTRSATVTRCDHYPVVEMQPMTKADPDFAETLEDTSPVSTDYARGQASLEADPVMLRSHMELGRAKLVFLDYYRADEEERVAGRPRLIVR